MTESRSTSDVWSAMLEVDGVKMAARRKIFSNCPLYCIPAKDD
jgi:hypothetical protein